MAVIQFNIDKTEDDYIHFDGSTLQELETFLYPDGRFEDCCGMITCIQNDKKIELSIASAKEYGVYVGFSVGKQQYLSLSDATKLSSVIDVWGDGLYVSEGLFISPKKAWKCICKVIETGDWDTEVDFITPDELPEEGNYI